MITKEIGLPLASARAYLEACMNGALALSASKRFAPALSWTDAHAFTCANPALPEGLLLAFDVGGKANAASADAWLQQRLEAALGEQQGFVLVEDWQLRPDHKVIVDHSLPAVFVQNEVYYALAPGAAAFDLTTSNLCPHFIGFVVASPKPNPGTQLTATQLDEMAGNVVAAYCGAYDGESYVLVTF
jgi:hypothetical protein